MKKTDSKSTTWSLVNGKIVSYEEKKLRNDTKWGIDFTCRKINNEDIKEKNEKLEKPLSKTRKK